MQAVAQALFRLGGGVGWMKGAVACLTWGILEPAGTLPAWLSSGGPRGGGRLSGPHSTRHPSALLRLRLFFPETRPPEQGLPMGLFG